MPLSNIQTEVLRLLARIATRELCCRRHAPEPRCATLFQRHLRFHDREERVASAALDDAQALEAAGYAVKWLRQLPLVYAAEVTRQNASTRLEWVADSDFRFFPTMRDETFGYVLHPADLAMNKVMRPPAREVRDLVDLVTVHSTILPLGAVIWAAVEKSPRLHPEGLIAEIRRNAHYPPPNGARLCPRNRSTPRDPQPRYAPPSTMRELL